MTRVSPHPPRNTATPTANSRGFGPIGPAVTTSTSSSHMPISCAKRVALSWRRFTVRRSKVDRWFDEVDPHLLVGGALFPGDLEALAALRVRAILSLCAEYLDDVDACAAAGVAAHRIPVHDDLAASPAQIEEAVRWIEERVARGERVYVHCAAGRGRSVSVACAGRMCRLAPGCQQRACTSGLAPVRRSVME